MTTPNVGVSSFIGFSEQSGYTTRVLPTTNFLPMISGGDSINREEQRIETAGIDSIGFSSTRFRRGRENITGNETVEVQYTGAELLFKHLFGSVVTTQPDPSNAPNVYDHTFTINDTLPVGLTLELNRGGNSFFVTGGNIQTAEISQSLDAYMNLNMTFIGRELATSTASSSSVPTSNAFAAPDCTLQWNSSALNVSNWTVGVNNNLDPERVFIGSRYRKQAVRGSRLEVTGTFEVEFDSETLFNDFVNATQRELLIQSIGDTIEGGFQNEFNLTIPVAVIQNAPINVSDEGRIVYTVDWKAYRTSSANEARLVMRNTTTAVS